MATTMQQSLLRDINAQTHAFLEQWYALTHRLEDIVQRYNDMQCINALTELFQEYGITLRPLTGYPALLYGEYTIGAPSTLLLWSDRGTNSAATHQWHTLAMRLLAFHLYQEKAALPINLKWLIDIGQEHQSSLTVSSNTTPVSIRTCLQADGCLYDIADAASFPAFALGTKGLLRVVLHIETEGTQAQAIYGSILPDATWRLTWALNTLKGRNEEVLIDGFYDDIVPEDDEVALLDEIPSPKQRFEQEGRVLLAGLRDMQARYAAQFVPTCNIIDIEAGDTTTHNHSSSTPSRLSSQARVLLDFYLVQHQRPEDIFNKLQHHLPAHELQDVQARLLLSIAPISTSLHEPFVQIHRAAIDTAKNMNLLHKSALPYIPYATESVCHAPMHPLSDVPTIFAQFGLVEALARQSTAINEPMKQLEVTMIAHMTHFIALLEEFRHANHTTR